MRAFFLVVICLVSPAWAGKPPPPAKKKQPVLVCPEKRSDVKPGSACVFSSTTYCDYPRGAWCECAASSCISPAGPIPDCESKTGWVCRDDGCPHPGVTTCRTEGKQCGYDDGMCSSSMVCAGGKWVSQGQQCRPAAPPHQ